MTYSYEDDDRLAEEWKPQAPEPRSRKKQPKDLHLPPWDPSPAVKDFFARMDDLKRRAREQEVLQSVNAKRYDGPGLHDEGWRTGSWAKCHGCGRDTALYDPKERPSCLQCWKG